MDFHVYVRSAPPSNRWHRQWADDGTSAMVLSARDVAEAVLAARLYVLQAFGVELDVRVRPVKGDAMSTKKQRSELVQKALQPDPGTGQLSEEFMVMAWALVQGAILRSGLDKVPRVRIQRGPDGKGWRFTVSRGRGHFAASRSATSLRDAVDALTLHGAKGTEIPAARRALAERKRKAR